MEIVDYRNGKYQGPLNSQRQRHGPGILLDDDLTFLVSHWNRNALHGPTLLYLAHGKYMYGQWNHNKPQGLNVFRAGDTVLLCQFQEGAPSGKCLLILERQSLAWVMEEKEGEWKVLEGGPLPNHRALLTYLQGVGLKVPDHFFSLTKFVCYFSQSSKHIKTHPCGANNCYFGFLQGLAIIFNPSNAVVSVGYHRNQHLCEYGARFQGQTVSEGSFEPQGQVISYKGERPTQQINNIFQALHQRSTNYDNSYLQSKSKLYGRIENLLRGKLKEIAEKSIGLHLAYNCVIDDSLNYRQVDGEESLQLCEKRDLMYSPPKKLVEKHKITSPYKEGPKEKGETSTTLKSYSNRRPVRSPLRVRQNEQEGQSCFSKQPLVEQPKLRSDFSRRAYLQKSSDADNPFVKVKQDSQRSPTFKGLIEQMESKYKLSFQDMARKEEMDEFIQKGSSKTKTKVAGLGQNQETRNESSEGLSALDKKSFDIKTIPRPSYEEIEERRKRVLREFKELNAVQTAKEKIEQSPVESSANGRKESLDSSFGYVPLSITKKREKGTTPSKLRMVSQDENIQSRSETQGKRPVLSLVQTAMEERGMNSRQQHNVLASSFRKIIQTEAGQKRSEKKLSFDAVQVVETISRSSSNQNSVSPSRQKRTYVYLFQ